MHAPLYSICYGQTITVVTAPTPYSPSPPAGFGHRKSPKIILWASHSLNVGSLLVDRYLRCRSCQFLNCRRYFGQLISKINGHASETTGNSFRDVYSEGNNHFGSLFAVEKRKHWCINKNTILICTDLRKYRFLGGDGFSGKIRFNQFAPNLPAGKIKLFFLCRQPVQINFFNTNRKIKFTSFRNILHYKEECRFHLQGHNHDLFLWH